MIRILLFFLGLVFSVKILAQTKVESNTLPIVFEKDSVYMGNVEKTNMPIVQDFYFSVTAPHPVEIEEIIEDCTCIAVEYPRGVLEPSSKGKIKLTFSPYRDGVFLKIVEVKIKNFSEPIYLKLTGYATGFYQSIELEYPHVTGNLRWKMKGIHMGTINNKEIVKKEVEFYNQSNQLVTFSSSTALASHLEIDFSQAKEIYPKTKGKFIVYYHPEKRKEYGYVQDYIVLNTNEPLTSEIRIPITAYIKPYVQHEFSDKAPQIFVAEDVVDLGRIVLPRDEMTYIEIQNVGNAPLEIKKVIPNYGCEVGNIENMLLAPMEKVILKVKIIDLKKEGSQFRSLTIFSNDPVQTSKVVTFKMHLTREKF